LCFIARWNTEHTCVSIEIQLHISFETTRKERMKGFACKENVERVSVCTSRPGTARMWFTLVPKSGFTNMADRRAFDLHTKRMGSHKDLSCETRVLGLSTIPRSTETRHEWKANTLNILCIMSGKKASISSYVDQAVCPSVKCKK
jgi:hypothetical protein